MGEDGGAESEAAALRRFLAAHPALGALPSGNRVRCALTGHELPLHLPALEAYVAGKKYRRLRGREADLGPHAKHLVPSRTRPRQLFCQLTLRHLNAQPEHVLRHLHGRRFQGALHTYERCQREGLPFVPAALRHKQPRRERRDGEPASSSSSSSGAQRGKKGGPFWEPPPDSSSDTDDSMSDLYPPELFSEKSPAEEEEEEAAMEVEPQSGPKRQKKQVGGPKKRLKSHRGKHFGRDINGK
ncbi:surfeit locus protein 2 [Anolis carolinensis]|uniref:surfeit locus protein 2 n=1 Tax=Anolis carolinensis TaxID=28377 RepID=UPI002F2B5B1A